MRRSAMASLWTTSRLRAAHVVGCAAAADREVMTSPLTAVVYSRISHDPLDLRLGVERQEQDCLRLVTQRGWELARPPYRENDTSASTRSTAKRPVYEAMLADLQAASAKVLVCYS